MNKIVMVDQLDTLARNKALAPLLTGVDVMIAGGGHERLGDSTDTAAPFNGHDADFISTDTYPIVTAGKDGAPVLIVTTDTEYTYLGRLVVDFDANGKIILGNLDPSVNGAYASTETTLQKAYNTSASADAIIDSSVIGSKVEAIVDAIDAVIASKDGNVFGYTDVYLEGDRVFGRVQETNLGNLTADANRDAAAEALDDQPFIVSLKNGGGIRASIGSVAPGGTKIPPTATSAKPEGAISQLDIENALRFDNKLMVFDTTPAGLLAILNYAASTSNGPTDQDGGFPQIGGLRFSYDTSNPAATRVESVGLVDANGKLIARVVENGQVVAGAPALISVVTLNFTANGGDGYPIKANGENFRFLMQDGSLSAAIDEAKDFTSAAAIGADVFANALGEQRALQTFLQEKHATPETAYKGADTPVGGDERIQQLAFNDDTVLLGETLSGTSRGDRITGTIGDDTIDGKAGIDTLRGGAGNDKVLGGDGFDSLFGDNGNDALFGGQGGDVLVGGDGDDLLDGGLGLDGLIGGRGIDTASYAGASGAVAVSLLLGRASGAAGRDTLEGIENVVGSSFADRLSGDRGQNNLDGGAGNDTLNGALGNDILTGGLGEDTFVFATRLSASNIDTITDFAVGEDLIALDRGVFEFRNGPLADSAFVTGVAAADASDRIVYDSATGSIYYDRDGSGAAAQVKFAQVNAGTALTYDDFVIV